MPESIIVALISLVGTALGAWLAIRRANSLTLYRLDQLEKKMDRHNNFIERLCKVEGAVKSLGGDEDK